MLRREERRHALVLDGADRDLLRLVVELACLLDVERAHRQLAELRLDGLTLRLNEAREAHHAVALDEVLVDTRAHVEQLRRVRLGSEVLHVHPELEHGERHRVRLALVRLVLARLGDELSEDAHVGGVLEDLVDGHVGEVLAGNLALFA